MSAKVKSVFWGYKPEIPILNNGKVQAVNQPLTQAEYDRGAAKFSSETLVKPGRIKGGPWISDKAQSIGSVKLCDSCVERYWGFWKKTGHKASWNNYFTGECDGCGERYMLLILFLPEPQFHKVLTGAHGRFASPKRKLFRFPWIN